MESTSLRARSQCLTNRYPPLRALCDEALAEEQHGSPVYWIEKKVLFAFAVDFDSVYVL
jgi:hypothetical protein